MLPLMHSTFVTTSTSWHVAGHDELLEELDKLLSDELDEDIADDDDDDNEIEESEELLDDDKLTELELEELLADALDELVDEDELLEPTSGLRIHQRLPGMPSWRSMTTCVPSSMNEPSYVLATTNALSRSYVMLRSPGSSSNVHRSSSTTNVFPDLG